MSMAQENFENAVKSADSTIRDLHGFLINSAEPLHPPNIVLAKLSEQQLSQMSFDLSAIVAALDAELTTRPYQDPVDLG